MGNDMLNSLSDDKIIDQICENADISRAEAKKALEVLTVALGGREAAHKALENAGSNIGALIGGGNSAPAPASSKKPAKKDTSNNTRSSSVKKGLSNLEKEEIVDSYRSAKTSWFVKLLMSFFGKGFNEHSEAVENTSKKKSAPVPEQKTAPKPTVTIAEKIAESSRQDVEEKEKKEENKNPLDGLDFEQFKLTNFLQVVLKVLRIQKIPLSSYTLLGVGMMCIGAIELLKSTRQFGDDAYKALIIALMELLGLDKESANEFFSKLGEYQLDRQNGQMIQVGTDALQIYLNEPNSPSLVTLIQTSMEKWISPNNESDVNTGIITVMFTDVVNSTATTHHFGDQAAQEMVRVHNAIIRRALIAYNGREVKHTGDGIMASFMWTTNAIDATISIQKAIKKYNANNPKIPLHVRIGLNSGEPIVEDDDLFGSTVQMAARVCAQASAEQIFISNVVKELATSKAFTFADRGVYSLKGIQGEQRLFEVIWDDEPASAQQNSNAGKDLSEVLPEIFNSEKVK